MVFLPFQLVIICQTSFLGLGGIVNEKIKSVKGFFILDELLYLIYCLNISKKCLFFVPKNKNA